MSTEELKAAIEKNLRFQGGTNDKWWLQASVKHYLDSGSVSGSFFEAIEKIVEAKDQRIQELEKENENLKEEWANDQTLKEGYVHQITSLEKELKDVKYGRDEVNKLNIQRTEDLRSANETIQSLQSQLTKCQEEKLDQPKTDSNA